MSSPRNAPDGAPETAELARAADVLYAAMRHARASHGQSNGGLSLSQAALLEPLAGGESLTISALADWAAISGASATRMCQQLEGKGLLARRRTSEDGRRVLMALTAEGERQVRVLRDELRSRQARTFAIFTPAERRRLADQLHRLAAEMNTLDD